MAKKSKEPEIEKDEADDKDEKKVKKGKTEADAEGEAEEGESEEGEGAAPAKKPRKKIVLIAGLALVFVLGCLGGAYGVYMMFDSPTSYSGGGDAKALKSIYYTMPEFLVNLNTGGKQTSFLKTTVVLELSHQTDVPLIEANLPRLFDTLNTYLRELRASDLAGSAGIQRLREEMLLRANQVMSPVKINDILFKEIVVQ